MFPVWMLVTGVTTLFMFFVLCVMSFGSMLILVGGKDAGGNSSPLASLGTLIIVGMLPCFCLIIPSACFSIGWGIYGLVLLSNTNWTCQQEMYDLVITQLITMSTLSCFGHLIRCFMPDSAKGMDDRTAATTDTRVATHVV